MSKENGEDQRCSKGEIEMLFPLIYVLDNVASLYTIEALVLFEKESIDSVGYKYKVMENTSCHRRFRYGML